MNWEAIGAIGEIFGAIAVVISLAYLATQIRQSNKMSRSQTSQNMIQLARQEILAIAEPPEIWTAFTKPDLPMEQKIKLHQWLMSSLRQREYEWLTWKAGDIDSSMFEAYAGVIPIILGTERTRRWWMNYGDTFYAPEFVAYVNVVLEDSPLTDFWESLEKW